MDCEAYECCDTELDLEQTEGGAAEVTEAGDWGELDFSKAPDEDLNNGGEAQEKASAEGTGEPEQESGLRTMYRTAENAIAKAENLRASERLQRMVKTGPTLAAKYLPEGVASRTRAGMGMREAAICWRNDRLSEENAALKQELANAARVVGSAGSAGKRKSDVFDEQWYDGT